IERKSIVSRLNSGRELAKERGVRMGRPEGSKMSDKDLLAKYPEVVRKLRKGLSIREVSKICGVSSATVQRVKKVTQK
ncbi:MAG: helix-turn-helix domain-containing protein, partial [Bacteroidales bacterium]|nr:helix-turn-helix domain-containing protein [Bacteroidales bacterium]